MADFSKLVADIESQYEKSSQVCANPKCTLVQYRDCLKDEEKLAVDLLKAVLEDIVGSGSAEILADADAMESKLSGYSVYLGAVELKNSPGSIVDAYIKAIPNIDSKLPVSVETAIDAVIRTLHPYYTRFERARIVGSRALQISYGAPIMVMFPGSFIDPIDIAEIEYFLNLIPISPVRA